MLPVENFDIEDLSKALKRLGSRGRIGKLLKRGVKKFVFLSCSGLSREPAYQLIHNLTTLRAQYRVIQGDVCNTSDVEVMVNEVEGPIGGVIQAAAGWSHNLFSNTQSHDWHAGIDPKVQGTWNIHNTIKSRESELDFFLLTSSIAGSTGMVTNGAYCAANYFLDNFARKSG
ncbi:hypothetical protein TWF696_006667 [Orbilia brochopaga]|uniref:Ketoreductase domain-containing protein n=1 Tax=Orbilia brochopaga TaxID=3140254 RepID=A0AAV9UR13_9PEZI